MGGKSKGKDTSPGPREVVLGVAHCPPLHPSPGVFGGLRSCCRRQEQGQGHQYWGGGGGQKGARALGVPGVRGWWGEGGTGCTDRSATTLPAAGPTARREAQARASLRRRAVTRHTGLRMGMGCGLLGRGRGMG